MMQKLSTTPVWIALGLLLVAGSCGRAGRPKMAPVKGHVVYRGQSLAGATVVLLHEGAPRFSTGVTDAQGDFTLTTFEPGDGAVVGLNQVAVMQVAAPPKETVGGVPDPKDYFRVLRDAKQKAAPPSPFPARYSDPKTSNLTVTIIEGENAPVLTLLD